MVSSICIVKIYNAMAIFFNSSVPCDDVVGISWLQQNDYYKKRSINFHHRQYLITITVYGRKKLNYDDTLLDFKMEVCTEMLT